MTHKYQRAQQIAKNVLDSKALSAEEFRAIQDVRTLNQDEIVYVVAWLKGAAVASKIINDFQHDLQ